MKCPHCNNEIPHKMPWNFSSTYVCTQCSKTSCPPKAYPLLAFLAAAAFTYVAKIAIASFGYSMPWYAALALALCFIYGIDRVALKLEPSKET